MTSNMFLLSQKTVYTYFCCMEMNHICQYTLLRYTFTHPFFFANCNRFHANGETSSKNIVSL